MPDTHDERGGDVAARVGRIADRIGGALDELRGLHGANRAKRGIAGAVADLRDIADEVRQQLAAATARAEKAEAEVARLSDDGSGWSTEENAEFEQRYGVDAAMRLQAANNRAWTIVQELRTAAVEAGLDPYQDPMVQRLAAALVGVEATSDSEPRLAKSSMLIGVFLRVSGLSPAEAGRLLGVSANAVNAWTVGARMNAVHFARLDELNCLAQKVKSTTFYNRRALITAPRDGQSSIYDQWLAEGWTSPIDPPGEIAHFEATPIEDPPTTEPEKP